MSGRSSYVWQVALTFIASPLTAFAEAAWYGATTGVMWWRVFAVPTSTGTLAPFRPAHWVLIVGLAMTLASFLWSLRPQRPRRRARPPPRAPSGAVQVQSAQLMAHPGELPLGVAARVVLSALGRLRERDLAIEMPDQPRHAVRLHGGQQRIELARRERAHFIERAGREHRVEARVDAAAQLRRARARGTPSPRLRRIEQRRQTLAMPFGERAAGRLQHLQRARDRACGRPA